MKSDRITARFVGALFLAAMVTSLAGGGILETILGAPDYLAAAYAKRSLVLVGVLLELTCALAVVGIAVVLYPVLKRHHEAMALGYVGFRVLEAAAIAGAVISPLSIIKLSRDFLEAEASEASHIQALGSLLLDVRAQLLGLILVVAFCACAFLLYTIFYKSKLVPRAISVWGLGATALLLAYNLLAVFGHDGGMILALPMILNEIFLGIWLLARGFNTRTYPL